LSDQGRNSREIKLARQVDFVGRSRDDLLRWCALSTRAFRIEPRGGPTCGRFLWIGNVRRGGRVDDVDALMLGKATVVNVAVNAGLYMFAACQLFPKRLRINQPAWEMQRVAA
jgi:hypothetical protein